MTENTMNDLWRDAIKNPPPNGVMVIVEGGIAKRTTGGEWFTGMEEPVFSRRIEWTVERWMPFPVYVPASKYVQLKRQGR